MWANSLSTLRCPSADFCKKTTSSKATSSLTILTNWRCFFSISLTQERRNFCLFHHNSVILQPMFLDFFLGVDDGNHSHSRHLLRSVYHARETKKRKWRKRWILLHPTTGITRFLLSPSNSYQWILFIQPVSITFCPSLSHIQIERPREGQLLRFRPSFADGAPTGLGIKCLHYQMENIFK